MKVLLTHAYFLADDPKEQLIMKPYVPLGILYISAYLEKNEINNDVFDTTFSTFEEQKKFLLLYQPDILGVYCNLMTKLQVIRLFQFIHQQPTLKNCHIIAGGPEIRHNAKAYLDAGAHLLIAGEGEQTFAEVCEYFKQHRQLPEKIPGTVSLDKTGNLIWADERPLQRDLDALPVPARHKINLSRYGDAWKSRHGFRTYSISTMRGCPYTCKWCSRAVYGGTYRRRSARLVVEEMKMLQLQYHAERLWFVDDVFTINHKWLREFSGEIQKKQINLPFEIITRADRMNDEVLQLLSESGCFRIWIGAESGSQRIIDAMDRRVDVQKVREMIIKTKKAGMEAGTFIMLGYPGETKNDIRETIEHLRVSEPTHYTVTITYPIAGTPLYKEVEKTITAPDSWQHITDRELDFKRSRSKRYYFYALRWMNHELRSTRAKNPVLWLRHKFYSRLAQTLMLFS